MVSFARDTQQSHILKSVLMKRVTDCVVIKLSVCCLTRKLMTSRELVNVIILNRMYTLHTFTLLACHEVREVNR
jgi:hypothetical protein